MFLDSHHHSEQYEHFLRNQSFSFYRRSCRKVQQIYYPLEKIIDLSLTTFKFKNELVLFPFQDLNFNMIEGDS